MMQSKPIFSETFLHDFWNDVYDFWERETCK